MSNVSTPQEPTVLGHKPGLFLLFFTEMWERFSYYGMRVLLVLFLVSEVAGGGWGWKRDEALNLYALYTGLVYMTPILGGIIADKFLGYRKAVLLGAFLMTLGHASLAFETETAFYAGLILLIIGNGFFKPNISSIVGQLYSNDPDKKDSAYTIFYMGINAGAFLGIMLCGYIGEKTQWNYGFGLAGIFMFLGMIMFQLGQSIFGELGLKATPKQRAAEAAESSESPLVVRDRLIVIGILSFFTIFFWMAFEQAGGSMNIFAKDYTARILTGQAATIFFWINAALTVVPLAIVTWVLLRLVAATKTRIPLSNAAILGSFVIIWIIAIWMLQKEYNMKAYELSVSALHVSATEAQLTEDADATARTMTVSRYMNDSSADLKVELASSDTKLLTVPASVTIPANAASVTFEATVMKDAANEKGQDVSVIAKASDLASGKTALKIVKAGAPAEPAAAPKEEPTAADQKPEEKKNGGPIVATIQEDKPLEANQVVRVVDLEGKDGAGKLRVLTPEQAEKYTTDLEATVVKVKSNETEVTASWFQILNSFFIIAFAPLCSRIWSSKLNPSAPVKFGLGLILLGIGFGALAWGSMSIPKGAATAQVSMWWLILAFLFHTLGELFVSPVGLSYVSKLAPAKLVGLMFGIWFLASAIANYLAGATGAYIDPITEKYGLATFFVIYTAIPIVAGVAILAMTPLIKKMMHGIE